MGIFGGDSPDYGQAIKTMEREKGIAQGRVAPWMSAGRESLGQYQAQLGMGEGTAFDVTQLPGYQQSLQRGLDAVNQGGAGAGMLMSGQRLMGLQDAGQDVFGQYYGDYMNRLQGLQGQGMGASQNLNQLNMGATSNIAQMMMSQEQAEAAASNSMMGDMMGMAGTLGGMVVGGPMGAGIGSSIGGMFSGGQPATFDQAMTNAPW